jgi:prepilin-type processing-associated H-X9-DG protein
MNANKGFTRADAIITMACIALVLTQMGAINAGGRERSKREVCLANLRMLTAAWQMYADDNSDKIVNGDVEEYGDWETSTESYALGGIHYREKPWILNDWASGLTLAQKKDKIMNGALFAYVKDTDVYKCPRANADETRSFSIVDQMNVIVISQAVLGTSVPLIKARQSIMKAYERMIFVDDGGCEGTLMGGWTVCFQTPPQWWDPPSARHGNGTTFSFVDGHAEYHKWLEPSTLDCAKNTQAGCSIPTTQTRDIRWAQIAAWGSQTASKLNP